MSTMSSAYSKIKTVYPIMVMPQSELSTLSLMKSARNRIKQSKRSGERMSPYLTPRPRGTLTLTFPSYLNWAPDDR